MLMDKINVAEWVSHKISLFGKMQRGRSPSFELFQLDMYAVRVFVKIISIPEEDLFSETAIGHTASYFV